MTVKQQEKIEELFLHVINIQQRMKNMETILETILEENTQLKAVIHTAVINHTPTNEN